MAQTKFNNTQLPAEATSFFNGGTGTHTASDAHIASTANPHSVTAAQAAAVSLTTLQGRMFLPFGVYLAISPITVTPSDVYSASINRTMTMKKWEQAVYIATTNNGSNYWRIVIYNASGASKHEINTSALAANTFSMLTVTSFSTAALSATDILIYIECVKVGSPGALYFYGPILEVEV
jgi:hypothetical protein